MCECCKFGNLKIILNGSNTPNLLCRMYVLHFAANFTGEKEVETSSRVQILETGDLLLAAVRESDAGKYTCIRSNEAGEVRGTAYLQVLGRYRFAF